ncbi:MerC family mercury resistance protein [Acidobacteria bacterium AH-259-D05]|nr:MerC family mercury resistance protein [Acidobacteria bacterium AH-259-D05]
MKDKLGFVGTLFTSLCCLGVSVVIAPLTAIGLGFLINDLILLPLVLVFLVITLWGLYTGWKLHDDRRPFLLGIVPAVLLIPSFFLSVYIASVLLLLLLVATIWNTAAARHAGPGGNG